MKCKKRKKMYCMIVDLLCEKCIRKNRGKNGIA